MLISDDPGLTRETSKTNICAVPSPRLFALINTLQNQWGSAAAAAAARDGASLSEGALAWPEIQDNTLYLKWFCLLFKMC